jgi:hypothetical protein
MLKRFLLCCLLRIIGLFCPRPPIPEERKGRYDRLVDDISSKDVDPKETARVDAAAACESKGLCHERNNFLKAYYDKYIFLYTCADSFYNFLFFT